MVMRIIKRAGLSWEQIKQKLENEGAKNKAYDSDVDGVFDLTAIPTITRDKLEYPTEDVSFAYLAAIQKLTYDRVRESNPGYRTVDSFSDKALLGLVCDLNPLAIRYAGGANGNRYNAYVNTSASTADFKISKVIDGSETVLSSESVDLSRASGHLVMFSVAGSTLKGFREDLTTAKISATDTDLASGYVGTSIPTGGDYNYYASLLTFELKAPATPLPKAKAIIEIDQLKQDLRPIPDNAPAFLKEDIKRYEILKQKGFTDEEIKLLFGDIQTHVDLASVTWGAFDYKGEATMLIIITGDNPYQSGAIEKQIEHAKSKNLKVLKPPRDYSEAIEQYRQLKQEFTEWIVGIENFAFQVLGHEDIEPLAVADFYYGELIEHKTHYKQLKRVPEWEMERTLNMWNERIKRVTAIPAERKEKHQKKMSEILKKGW